MHQHHKSTAAPDLGDVSMETGDTFETEDTLDDATVAPEAPPVVTALESEFEVEQIGRYRILSKLGEGGFGFVYLAEQTEPVRRRVALKIIKPGMDSRAIIARFEAERQALALMDHPCIAHVHDAGTTERGRPYFVMEHVVGEPLTNYCDRQQLGLRDRLELFIRVCDAIQHAHQKGIIHRDLKPGNILVTEQDGLPKVIDFGIAKALHEKLTDNTVFTAQGQVMGTPEFMSPEQAEGTGDDIDTRTDIYALGVVLYQVLTGALPFDSARMRSGGFARLQQMICEEDPPRPSTRLTTIGSASDVFAASRGVDRRTLARSLRGDLDWIVMKCLEKDRARRYDTANALITDIRRHLNHEPILAGPPTTVYRMRKFVRRNRVAVSVAAIVGVVLLAGSAGTVLGLIQAIAAREDARERAAELELITQFQSNMLSEIDPEAMGLTLVETFRSGVQQRLIDERIPEDEATRTLSQFDAIAQRANPTNVARRILDEHLLRRAVETIDSEFVDRPETDAALKQSVANVYKAIGLADEAMPLAERALKLRRREFGNDHEDTIESVQAMGSLLWSMRRLEDSKPFLHEAYELTQRVLGPDDPRTLAAINSMATLLAAERKFDEAQQFYERALEGRRRVLGEEAHETIATTVNMGSMYERMERIDLAEAHYRQALEAMTRTLGPDHLETLLLMNNLGTMLREVARYEEGSRYLEDALARSRTRVGDDHPATLVIINNLGLLYEQWGKLDQALEHTLEVVEVRRRTLGTGHPYTLFSIDNLAILLAKMERYEESEEAFKEALEGCRRVLGEDNFDTLIVLDNMGDMYAKTDRYDEAERCYEETLAGRRALLGTDHSLTIRTMRSMVRLLVTMERYSEAEPLALEAHAAHVQYHDESHRHALSLAGSLAVIYDGLHQADPTVGHDATAEQWRLRATQDSSAGEE